MPENEYKEMRTILEEDPAAAEKARDLAKAADMGLQIASAGSPAFVGVMVVRVLSASVIDFKNPDIQLAAEDDKVSWVTKCLNSMQLPFLCRMSHDFNQPVCSQNRPAAGYSCMSHEMWTRSWLPAVSGHDYLASMMYV